MKLKPQSTLHRFAAALFKALGKMPAPPHMARVLKKINSAPHFQRAARRAGVAHNHAMQNQSAMQGYRRKMAAVAAGLGKNTLQGIPAIAYPTSTPTAQ